MTDNDRKAPIETVATRPVTRAIALRTLGDLDGAIALLTAVAAERFADPEVAFTLAQMLDESGQPARAEPWFRHALKLEPTSVMARIGYATFLMRNAQPEAGCVVFEVLHRDLLRAVATNGGEPIDEHVERHSALGAVAVRLGAAYLELGDTCRAMELASPWLSNEDHWERADYVYSMVAAHDGLDLTRAAESGLVSGEVSPLMVCHLLEQAARACPPRLPTLERVITAANEQLRFEWQNVAPEVEEALVVARGCLARAAMRGEVHVADFPNLASATGIHLTPRHGAFVGGRSLLTVRLCGLMLDPPNLRTSASADGTRRCSVPVFIGELEAGFATVVLDHPPRSGHVQFEAHLDPANTPASWSGRDVPFLYVERGAGRRGRVFERIVVASDARPLPVVRLVRFSEVEDA